MHPHVLLASLWTLSWFQAVQASTWTDRAAAEPYATTLQRRHIRVSLPLPSTRLVRRVAGKKQKQQEQQPREKFRIARQLERSGGQSAIQFQGSGEQSHLTGSSSQQRGGQKDQAGSTHDDVEMLSAKMEKVQLSPFGETLKDHYPGVSQENWKRADGFYKSTLHLQTNAVVLGGKWKLSTLGDHGFYKWVESRASELCQEYKRKPLVDESGNLLPAVEEEIRKYQETADKTKAKIPERQSAEASIQLNQKNSQARKDGIEGAAHQVAADVLRDWWPKIEQALQRNEVPKDLADVYSGKERERILRVRQRRDELGAEKMEKHRALRGQAGNDRNKLRLGQKVRGAGVGAGSGGGDDDDNADFEPKTEKRKFQ